MNHLFDSFVLLKGFSRVQLFQCVNEAIR